MAKESTSDLQVGDDFHFLHLIDEDGNDQNENYPDVTDEDYAEELQLQEAIMASVMFSQTPNNPSSSTTQQNPPSTDPNPELNQTPKLEIGESSKISCEICVENRDSNEMFRIEPCGHSFCSDCINKHVESKIQDDINRITCLSLNCGVVLELDACKSIISKDLLVQWDEALSKSMVLVSQRFYCPFCSAMLENDNGGEVMIRQSECPMCRRLFCAQCYVAWHSGVDCEEFQSLNKEEEREREDLMVIELVKKKQWRTCPGCKSIVEKTEGCLHITCRCKFEFCYGCEAEWTEDHAGVCQRMQEIE